AVDDLSFSVLEGDVYGFLGQNGAGKSTTIRMLLSLIKPTSGDIQLFGQSLFEEREYILQRIGAVVEKPDVYKYLSGFENLKLFSKLSFKSISAHQLWETLELVGLKERAHDPVRVYSQGMKQRLGIAVALVHNPDLIILDEPTNGLDPQGIADIRNLILYLSKEKRKTIIVSSHLLSEIEQVADRMLIIHKGKKVVEGKVVELLNPEKVTLELVTSNNEEALRLIGLSAWSQSVRSSAHGRIVLDTDPRGVIELNKMLVQQGIGVSSLKSMNSLEAYFLSLTAAHEVL
ncbi:MAG: hypothetical protein RL131_1194, partial [Bacteroidota bacterium]